MLQGIPDLNRGIAPRWSFATSDWWWTGHISIANAVRRAVAGDGRVCTHSMSSTWLREHDADGAKHPEFP